MGKEEKRKCPVCKKLTLVSEGIEKINGNFPWANHQVKEGRLYLTRRCADCGHVYGMDLQTNDKRPKIPLKPLSGKSKAISPFLWLASIIMLFLSLILQRTELTIIFWVVILCYAMLGLKSNIAQCFKKKYILKSLLFLPLLFIPKFLCEQLLSRANIWWLNLGISLNFLFGSTQVIDLISFFIMMGLLVLLFFPCNYYEEYYFRERWYLVVIWALLHLFLGISQFTLGEFFILCGLGIGFKLIYDKHGIQVSYPTHVFVNIATVIIAIILIFL